MQQQGEVQNKIRIGKSFLDRIDKIFSDNQSYLKREQKKEEKIGDEQQRRMFKHDLRNRIIRNYNEQIQEHTKRQLPKYPTIVPVINNLLDQTITKYSQERELENYHMMNSDIKNDLMSAMPHIFQVKLSEPVQSKKKLSDEKQQLFLQLVRPPSQVKKDEPHKSTEEKIKEEARWQFTTKKERDLRIQQLEEQMAALKARAVKGQGQFPKAATPRAYASRVPRVPSVGQRVLSQLLEAASRAPQKNENSVLKKMEEIIQNDPKMKEKLIRFLEKNKAGQFYISSLKRNIYISRPNLDKLRKVYLEDKEGGFLPLIPILAGIAAAGSIAGGAAGIASAVNKKKAEDAALEEQHRHNISLEDAARGKGLKDDVVNFVQENELDDDVKRLVKKTLKGLASAIPMRKEGSSLILTPYKKGSSLILNWK